MKEYSLLAAGSIFIALFLDYKLKTGVLRMPRFYIFLLVILFFKFLVNGYLTGKEIVLYNRDAFFGFRIGSIPLEDFFFGFSMVAMTIIFWEYFKRRQE